VTMAEVIRDEYETGIEIAPVPMFVQSGDDRYDNVDKMVLKEADVLPHGLINHIGTKLGADGELLDEYVTWVRDRILALRPRPEYEPVLHFDVYGTIGAAFGGEVERVAGYLAALGKRAKPFRMGVEHVHRRGKPRRAGGELGRAQGGVAPPVAAMCGSRPTNGATPWRTSNSSWRRARRTSSM
jgi:methylaspartate ammonia-lyase